MIELIATVNGIVASATEQFDFLVCGVGPVTAAPIVNSIAPDLVRIDPTDGDVSLLDGPFWDCPPYGDT